VIARHRHEYTYIYRLCARAGSSIPFWSLVATYEDDPTPVNHHAQVISRTSTVCGTDHPWSYVVKYVFVDSSVEPGAAPFTVVERSLCRDGSTIF